MSEYFKKNPNYISDNSKKYYAENPNKFIDRVKKYYIENKEKKSSYNKKYREENLDDLRKKQKTYLNNRIKNDPDFRAKRSFRRLLRRFISEKRGGTAKILGYTHKDMIAHFGRFPIKGEEIDHKIPVTWFIGYEYAREINDLRNLQLLTRSENRKKSNCFACEVDFDYYKSIIHLIKPEFKDKIKWKH